MVQKVELRFYRQPWLHLSKEEEIKDRTKRWLVLRHRSDIPEDALGVRTSVKRSRLDVWMDGKRLVEDFTHKVGRKRKWVDAFGTLTTETIQFAERSMRNGYGGLIWPGLTSGFRTVAGPVSVTYVSGRYSTS